MEKERNSININDIAALIRETVLRSYGVISISDIYDKNVILQLTKKGKKVEGLFVKLINNRIDVDLHIDLSFGIKITEALRECHKNICYMLKKHYPSYQYKVNVFIEKILNN